MKTVRSEPIAGWAVLGFFISHMYHLNVCLFRQHRPPFLRETVISFLGKVNYLE